MEATGYYDKVYRVTRLIPSGRVSTYGAIADFLGGRGGARMVGWALNNSHSMPHFIPAHRVVNRKGLLTGKHHFSGQHVMREPLEAEGVRVIEDQVSDFEKLFWDPVKELSQKDFF